LIRIIICDDQDIVREGLQKILEADPQLQVIGTAEDGAQAVELVDQTQPDLVLMDLKMPGTNGIQATRIIRQRHPEIKVLVLTTYDDDEWLFDAIRNGASGYLLKDTPRASLIQAIKGTVAGNTYVDPAVAGKLFATLSQNAQAPLAPAGLSFSEREMDVLSLLARGLSNQDIAQKLFLSEGTVRNYTSSILNKLGVNDRTQAAILAIKYGLVKE
jgi:DNA-binding NarL/FixJ family response regulator